MAEQCVIYFIRHGMTEGNRLKQYTGWSDPCILPSERFRLKHASAPVVDEVWCSDLKRAVETSNVLFPGHTLRQTWMIREMYFGDFEGKDYNELKKQSEYRYWLNDMKERAPVNGETMDDFHNRIHQAWKKIKQTKSKRIAVVTHSGWIREWCQLYVKDHPLNNLWHIPYAAGIKASFQRKGGKWHCTLLQEAPLMEKKTGY